MSKRKRKSLPQEDVRLFNELKDDLSLDFLVRTHKEYGVDVVLRNGEIMEILT